MRVFALPFACFIYCLLANLASLNWLLFVTTNDLPFGGSCWPGIRLGGLKVDWIDLAKGYKPYGKPVLVQNDNTAKAQPTNSLQVVSASIQGQTTNIHVLLALCLEYEY
jgi:hypothetical protein